MDGIGKALRKYWSHAALAVQETLAYRTAYIINVVSSCIFYLIVFFVWRAVYGGGGSGGNAVGGLTWNEMQGYLLVSLLTSTLVSTSSEFRISRQIRTGNIAIELLRPVDYQLGVFSVTLGNSLSEGVLVSVFVIAFAFILRTPAMPRDLLSWLLFLPALGLSLTVKFLLIYVFSLSCFWTNSLLGVSWLRRGLSDFFSGALIPLSFFPAWLLPIADALPFRGIVFVPAMVFIGKLRGSDYLRALALEAAWIAALWIVGKLIWRRALRKVCIQGG